MASAPDFDQPTRVPDVPGLKMGDVLADRYTVTRVIGRGGMATVVEALHKELGSRVAIKVLHGTAAIPSTVERFLREARAIFPLRGENVCRVLDMGRLPNGVPFMVMEYLEGKDFAAEFRGRKCDPKLAAGYIVQACKGLAEAHAMGIVHRDVKPANLFLTTRTDGSELVKVLDFGISKIRTLGGEESHTADGQVLGTPRFMAPEQFGGSDTVDARTDVWAIGLVLYRLLTGRLPYTAVTVGDIYNELMNVEPRPIRAELPDLDPAYAAVVMRCLERQRLKRFANARALADALEPFAGYGKRNASPLIAMDANAPPENPTAAVIDATQNTSGRRRVRIVAGIGAIGAVGIVVLLSLHHGSKSAPPVATARVTPALPSETASPPASVVVAVATSAPPPTPAPSASASSQSTAKRAVTPIPRTTDPYKVKW